MNLVSVYSCAKLPWIGEQLKLVTLKVEIIHAVDGKINKYIMPRRLIY